MKMIIIAIKPTRFVVRLIDYVGPRNYDLELWTFPVGKRGYYKITYYGIEIANS